MNKVLFEVPDISCGHCVMTVENELGELDGVISVKADAAEKKVEVEYQDPISEQRLIEVLQEINYPVKAS